MSAWRAVGLLLGLCACSTPPAPVSSETPAASAPATAARTERLIVIGTSDLHGHLEALPVLGGYLKVVRQRAAEQHAAVLLVDAGDMFQGTLESNLVEGESIVQAYQALGYAAVAVGNHEFDFGPLGPAASVPNGQESDSPEHDPRGALRARAKAAGFPFLLANVEQPRGGVPLAPVVPSALVHVGGVKVGVVGVTSAQTASTTLSANVRDLSFTDPATSLAREARALRARGAQVVVGLVHAGSKCERFGGDPAADGCLLDQEIFRIAEALPRGLVDAMVAGHTHQAVAHTLHGIPVVQSYHYGRAFGRIDLELDARGQVRAHRLHAPRELCAAQRSPCLPGQYEGESVVVDANLEQLQARYAELARARREQPVGVTFLHEVSGSYAAESPLGNLLAELLRQHLQADVALVNGGSLRSPLPAGPLRYGDLFASMPFDNRVARVNVDVRWLRALLTRNLSASQHGVLSVAGVEVVARCGKAGLELQLYRLDSAGKRGALLRDHQPLSLVTSDYLLQGGDDFATVGGFGAVQLFDELVRDVYEQGLKRLGEVDPAQFYSAQHPRLRLPSARPVRCD